jgi:DNA-binding SARP family transcriptional activator
VRRLATLLSRAGRGSEAVGILVRLLAVDPYDEQVHRRLVTGLVRAGRHGEARRAFDRWCLAMREIDAPLPDSRVVDAGLRDVRVGAVLTPR